MSGAIKRQTSNFGFNIINYDFPRWHTFEWQNWDVVDAVLAAAGITSIRGVWANSTQYVIGNRVVDDTDNTIWLCVVNHTSAVSGTFLADRTANPTYWTVISTLPVNRGLWVTAVNYSTQDIVRFGNAYYFCVAAHVSGVFATDLAGGKWALIFDLQDAIDAETQAVASAAAALTSENNAATSETNAANSETAAGVSETNAATSETNAAISEVNAATSASNALTSENNADTSETNAANSAAAAATSESNAAISETSAAASAALIGSAIRYTVQALTGPQQVQALDNLGFNAAGKLIISTSTSLGAQITAALDDAGVRTLINAQPLSTVSTGVAGDFRAINTPAGSGFSLPAGSTWEWWWHNVSSPGNTMAGTALRGISAGGTTIATGIAGIYYQGWIKRLT